MSNLSRRAWLGCLQFVAGLLLLIQLPAWSTDYWRGWFYWFEVSLCVIAITAIFLHRSPALIERRLAVGAQAEIRTRQQRIQRIHGWLCLALVLIPGWDHRFGWSPLVPETLRWGLLLVLAGFALVAFAFQANSHAAATVRIDAGQPLIDTGPYAWVRHPMDSGAVLLFWGTPLMLGSGVGLVPAALLTVGLGARLLDEESSLRENFPGIPSTANASPPG
ncbi:MAG: methyltransferase family protein [Planctomycetaceae bacterium]|jgi:protein-S-isoprenylcysteine O-methyltransferase Ste14